MGQKKGSQMEGRRGKEQGKGDVVKGVTPVQFNHCNNTRSLNHFKHCHFLAQ